MSSEPAAVGPHREPCSDGFHSAASPTFPDGGHALLCFISHHRYWDQEVLRAKSYKREPSLMKAIVQCYWKSCLVLGIFTFLEVKIFPCRALLSSVSRSVLRWV